MNTDRIDENEDMAPGFDSLFNLSSEEEEKHEARMIMYRFLSEMERVSGQKRGLKTKLAGSVGKSKSFITQLFNGDKLVSLSMLARFQKALGIKFKITAYPADEFDRHAGHQPKYSVNFFVGIGASSSAETIAVSTSDSVTQVQIIEKADPQLS